MPTYIVSIPATHHSTRIYESPQIHTVIASSENSARDVIHSATGVGRLVPTIVEQVEPHWADRGR